MVTYELPRERVAQRPVYPYDAAKLLVVERGSGRIVDTVFRDISAHLRADDTLVFNNSKVVKARLLGKFVKSSGQVELLLLCQLSPTRWVALGKPLNRIESGDPIAFSDRLLARAVKRLSALEVEVEFEANPDSDLNSELEQVGIMPIPPYIRKGQADKQDEIDYQTNFAELSGSIAAPTASLHFTPELMQRIKTLGCEIEFVTLHVGPASFLPLFKEGEEQKLPKTPGAESFTADYGLVERLMARRAAGKRIIAVGTTVVRALESMAQETLKQGSIQQKVIAQAAITELFITPGYKFNLVDALVTNFHQPATTHLLLVESLLGGQLISKCYAHALANDYRFLSYGDGMMIV